MEHRGLSEEYTELAADLIETVPELEHLRGAEVTIGYLWSDRKKKSHGMTVYGECEKVPDKLKWCVPFDFLVVIYDQNCADMSEEKLKILLIHELMHVGIEEKENAPRYYIRPHDTQDFRQILETYGYGWQN